MMRIVWPVLILVFSVLVPGAAQFPSYSGKITINRFPQEKQICERQKDKQTAPVKIAGTVDASSNYDQLRLTVTLGGTDSAEVVVGLNYVNGFADFEIEYDLLADLVNHQFLLEGLQGTSNTVEWLANDVVAGDIYIINGQSNAQAYLSIMPEDIVEFTRSYANNQWGDLSHSFPGRWGGHLAKVLSSHLGYPIGIFNFADGAQPISYFQKNLEDPTQGNYGSMLARLSAAGVESPLAVFWFHGEANGWDTAAEVYYSAYDTLHHSWKSDFDIDASFLFQVRHLGCAHPNPDIFEAQRQLAEQNPDMHIMSTTNADQDSCHYRWEEGYRALADRMSKVVQSKLYGETVLDNSFAPNVKKVELQNPTTLRITFEPAGVPLGILGDPSYDFRHEESGRRSVSAWPLGDTLIVQFDSIVNIGEHFSYLSHPGPTPDWVVTSSGVGILEFYNQPIVEYIVSGVSLAQKEPLTIYPNPVTQNCFVEWQGEGETTVQIVDLLGREVYHETRSIGQKGINLDLSSLATGAYQLIVRSADRVGVAQLIKGRL